MKIKHILTISFLCCLCAVSFCSAKENTTKASKEITVNRDDAIALARTYIQAQRQTIVAMNLELTKEESQKFWPIYNEYQKELEPLRDRTVALIISYGEKFETLSDEDSKQMLEELLSVQETEGKIRREFLTKFGTALPIKKVVRFYQLENKMNAEIRYSMSLEIPLLELTSGK